MDEISDTRFKDDYMGLFSQHAQVDDAVCSHNLDMARLVNTNTEGPPPPN